MGTLKPLTEITVDMDTLLARLTEIRAGYLDNLTDLDAPVSGARADLTTLETRLSDARATKLDNLDMAISTLNDLAQSDILSDATPFAGENIDGKISDRPTNPLLTNDARLDNLDAPVSGAKADLTTLETRLSDARATKLDNLDKAISTLNDLSLAGLISSILNIRNYTYAASDVLLESDDIPVTTEAEAYTKVKEIIIPRTVGISELRIAFDMKREAAGAPSYVKIYKNGVEIGTERAENDGSWTNYSEDIPRWVSNDRIQLYGYQAAVPGECNVRNFRIYGDQTVNYYAATLVW